MRFLAGHNSWIDEYLSEAMWYDLYLMFFFLSLEGKNLWSGSLIWLFLSLIYVVVHETFWVINLNFAWHEFKI